MHAALKSTIQLLKRGAIRAVLNAMGQVGIGSPAGRNGAGLIMTLHRVEPAGQKSFAPNALLSITPEFLKTVIEVAKSQNMQPIAVCDIKDYIASSNDKPFIAFTLDDGYRNNRDHAAPVFQQFEVPYTIFVSKGLSERTHTLWWETTEQLLSKVDALELTINDQNYAFPARSTAEKHQTFAAFVQLLLEVPEDDAIQALNEVAVKHGISAHDIAKNLIMDANELKALNDDPLCHLAPHTVSHINLSKAAPDRLQSEIEKSVDYIRELTGDTLSTKVFSYPYGKPFATCEAVFKAAQSAGMEYGVVTSPGSVSANTEDLNWMRLPRMSVNGYYQSRAAAHALLCGVPTLLKLKSKT